MIVVDVIVAFFFPAVFVVDVIKTRFAFTMIMIVLIVLALRSDGDVCNGSNFSSRRLLKQTGSVLYILAENMYVYMAW